MQEFQVCTDFLGISQTKSRMCLPQRNQPFHVIEHITMLVFQLPVDGIDAVRAVVGIGHPFLIAHELIAGKEERYPL